MAQNPQHLLNETPLREFTFKQNIMEKLLELFVDESYKDAIRKAFSSKGKNKGYLKTKCPPMGTPEAAAWNAIQMHCNPFKVGFGHLLMTSPKDRVMFNLIELRILKSGIDYNGWDKDREGLESVGAW